MKTKIYSLLALAAFALTGCSDDAPYPVTEEKEMVEVSLADLGVSVTPDEIVISRAADEVDHSNFLVRIVDPEGEVAYESTVATRNEIVTLPVGEGYSLQIHSHEVENAAWATPYYYGEKKFNVSKNEITDLGNIECKFSNIRVSINYTDELRAMLGSDVKVTVKCSENGSSLEYATDETRSGYFKALEGSTTLAAELAGTIKGQPTRFTRALNDVKAGQHRIITFSVRQGNTTPPDEYGAIAIGDGLYITADVVNQSIVGGVIYEEKGDNTAVRPGTEDPVEPEQPVDPVASPITITSTDVDFDKENPTTYSSYKVYIHADETVSNLLVQIKSDNDNFIASAGSMLPLTFDLATVDDDMAAVFSDPAFGLPVQDQVAGQTDVLFDVSGLVPLLAGFPGHHQFVITVTDAKGNTLTKTMKIIAN